MHNEKEGWVDLRHMNVNGHRAMAEMLISMTQRVYCEELKAMAEEFEEEEGDEWTPGEEYIPAEDTLEYVPRVRHLPTPDVFLPLTKDLDSFGCFRLMIIRARSCL